MGLRKAHSSSSFKIGCVISVALLLVSLSAGCRRSAPANGNQTENPATSNTATAATTNSASADGGANAAQLDAEIARLEKIAQRNPSDDEVRDALAQAYVRRGNARRAAQQLREALRDYQNALRINADNEEAQRNAAEISPQVEGQPTGENGEPAPLPITPNVTTEGEEPSPTKQPSPTKKRT